VGEFVIYTDQQSLAHLNEQMLHTAWQQKVFTKLLGLNYIIVYMKGSDNRVVDALSKNPQHMDGNSINCLAISTVQPDWLAEVLLTYESDPYTAYIVAKLLSDSESIQHFSLHNGLLRYKGKVWVGHDPALQNRLIADVHSSAIGGHSGIPVTCRKLKQTFAWKGLKSAVTQFVQTCLVCQQAKPDRTKLLGLLQPLPVPAGAWQTISLDFVEGMSLSGSANCILVVIDMFTKYGHFIALKHPFTAFVVDKLFMDHVYRLHGMPTSIVSDRGSVLTSHLWRELFKLADVQLRMSSAYHPQIDG
jgi:hypothetical protein